MITINVRRTKKTYGIKALYVSRWKSDLPSSTFLRIAIEGGKENELVDELISIDLDDLRQILKFVDEKFPSGLLT